MAMFRQVSAERLNSSNACGRRYIRNQCQGPHWRRLSAHCSVMSSAQKDKNVLTTITHKSREQTHNLVIRIRNILRNGQNTMHQHVRLCFGDQVKSHSLQHTVSLAEFPPRSAGNDGLAISPRHVLSRLQTTRGKNEHHFPSVGSMLCLRQVERHVWNCGVVGRTTRIVGGVYRAYQSTSRSSHS